MNREKKYMKTFSTVLNKSLHGGKKKLVNTH